LHSLFRHDGQQTHPIQAHRKFKFSTFSYDWDPLIVPCRQNTFCPSLCSCHPLYTVDNATTATRADYRQPRVEELRESLWSWTLFWAQSKALLLSSFAVFFPQRATREEEQASTEAIETEPTARNIREIYRALLKRCPPWLST